VVDSSVCWILDAFQIALIRGLWKKWCSFYQNCAEWTNTDMLVF